MTLRTLLKLQFLYALLGLIYLAVSFIRIQGGEAGLSKAPPAPAAAAFVVYALCVYVFGVRYREKPYRIAMAIAIPVLAFGGVLVNIVSYFRIGLEGYHSFGAWAIGTAINIYGVIWNIVAAFGKYER
ncbi:hypothetical protein [Sphingomonas cavernae]|uniref:Uncharacterized protein n=1 Tax=Sphingomonas cavernae TaxID=2320861 RepID=A0A418WP07_9SPHN|nr:hypothetical protein [Sphingomonas cavernae]RJF92968.1 hypothetical protein D3876_00835 [Sphingomonas cavernae]